MNDMQTPNSAGHREDERARIEQSNDVAALVFDEVKRVWPDLHPVLDLRYGIADALWEAGYRRVARSATTTAVIVYCAHDWSLTGAEGPIRDLGRWPVLWSCDICGATVVDL